MSINQELAGAQHRADLGQAVQKLESNRHFNKLITQQYFVEYAASRVSALASVETTPEMKLDIMNELEAISRFKNWLLAQRAIGVQAEREIAAIHEYQRQLDAGEIEDEEEADTEE